MARFVKKKILRIIFETTSPLAIGSGYGVNTDNDVLVDSLGRPFIPGSAMAGVILSRIKSVCKDASWHDYFGYVENNTEIDGVPEIKESRLSFSDAILISDKNHITRRDFVALDSFKTAKVGAKFDIEVVEPGIKFASTIEQDYLEYGDEDYIERILDILKSDDIAFGMKTSRGLGRVILKKAGTKEFDFSLEKDVMDWLRFDVGKIETEDVGFCSGGNKSLLLGLELQGGISIRRYTTKAAKDKTKSVPDYEQLSEHFGDDVFPVMPGTSWAGAFIHQMKRNVPDSDMSKDKDGKDIYYFGYVNESTKQKQRSYVEFSETVIKGGIDKVMTRNAIDRFSGGTVGGALFTEKTHYGGTTTLKITFRKLKNADYSDAFRRALASVVADLHAGFMAVGGSTSIGRGIFKVTSVNGVNFAGTSEELYSKVIDILKEATK